MNIEMWIIGQIAIDAVLAGILLWLVVMNGRRKTVESNQQTEALRKSEEIIRQMQGIARELEENLEEKRKLTHRLLGRLDETLERARNRYEQFNDLFKATETASERDRVSLKQTQDTRVSIKALLDKGLSKEEVAQRLGLSVGEIELFLKLEQGA
jgi:DNA-binding NarL/FixJ family response regulator